MSLIFLWIDKALFILEEITIYSQLSLNVEASEEESQEHVDLSIFSGNLRRDDHDKARDSWTLSDGKNFRVRSKNFCFDKLKVWNICSLEQISRYTLTAFYTAQICLIQL